jgi:hypothetical protein
VEVAWRAFVYRAEMVLVEVELNQNIELNENGLTGCYVVICVFLGEARFPLCIFMMQDGQGTRIYEVTQTTIRHHFWV